MDNLSADILNAPRKGNPYIIPEYISNQIETEKRHKYIDKLVKIKSEWEQENLKDLNPSESWNRIYSVLPDGCIFFMDYNIVTKQIKNKRLMTDLNQLKEAYEFVRFAPDLDQCKFGLIESKKVIK